MAAKKNQTKSKSKLDVMKEMMANQQEKEQKKQRQIYNLMKDIKVERQG